MNENLKYKLTNECITIGFKKLYRIEALKDFSTVKKGDKGGFVESEKNLLQYGDCWVSGDAMVFDNAKVCGRAVVCGMAMVYGNAIEYGNAIVHGNSEVYGNAKVSGDAEVYGNAIVHGEAEVYGNAIVHGEAEVYGKAEVCGNAEISNNTDYIVFKDWWSDGRYFTWTRSNNMWIIGCFYGSGEELITKAYKEDSELSGREFERVVKYVESILKEDDYRQHLN